MGKVGGSYGGPFAKLIPAANSPQLLAKLGNAIVQALSRESKLYFAKRRWSGLDPMGGPPIWESFTFRIRGKSTVEVSSSFYGMAELASGDIPERKMTWLTQEAKNRHPENYELTDTEKKRGVKKTWKLSPKALGKDELPAAPTPPIPPSLKPDSGMLGKPKKKRIKGNRMPLVVPVRESGGNIVLRMAPLKTSDAWIHPGIAKFTFFEVAIRKARQECLQLLKAELVKAAQESKR